MATIQLFLQFEGNRRIELVEIEATAKVRDLIAMAVRAGLADHCGEGVLVFAHDSETPFELDAVLCEIGVHHKHRIHVHRCRKVEVTLHFNDVTKKHHFPPSATVEKVKREFVKEIDMSPVDATEHVLQICGTTDRPEPDLHIGSLVCDCCVLCFDLVPIKRIEG